MRKTRRNSERKEKDVDGLAYTGNFTYRKMKSEIDFSKSFLNSELKLQSSEGKVRDQIFDLLPDLRSADAPCLSWAQGPLPSS